MNKMLFPAVSLMILGVYADLERGMLILNQDPTEFQARMPAEKMTEEGAKEYFDLVNIGKNTHFFICPNAHTAYYDSKVWDTCYRTDPDLDGQVFAGHIRTRNDDHHPVMSRAVPI